jgi:hypothetical protein
MALAGCFFCGQFAQSLDSQGLQADRAGISTKLSTETLDQLQTARKSTT